MFRSFFNISLISDKKYILNNVSNSVDIKHKICQNLFFFDRNISTINTIYVMIFFITFKIMVFLF